jgi:hypothetical protein
MTKKDGHKVMIIPHITLKGLIFIQAHPTKYLCCIKSTAEKKKLTRASSWSFKFLLCFSCIDKGVLE